MTKFVCSTLSIVSFAALVLIGSHASAGSQEHSGALNRLGIELEQSDDNLTVTKVHSGSLAEKSGLRKGDQIKSVNNQDVSDQQALKQRLEQQSDSSTRLTVRRDGREQSFTFQLNQQDARQAQRDQERREDQSRQSQQASDRDAQREREQQARQSERRQQDDRYAQRERDQQQARQDQRRYDRERQEQASRDDRDWERDREQQARQSDRWRQEDRYAQQRDQRDWRSDRYRDDREGRFARQDDRWQDRQWGQDRWMQDERYGDRSTRRMSDYDPRRYRDDEDTIYSGEERAALGVTLSESSRGVRVARLIPGSPAAEAGLRQGDQIVSLDGRDVSSYRDIIRHLSQHEPEDQCEIEIQRDGRYRTLEVTLAPRQEVFDRSRDWQDQRSRDESSDRRRQDEDREQRQGSRDDDRRFRFDPQDRDFQGRPQGWQDDQPWQSGSRPGLDRPGR